MKTSSAGGPPRKSLSMGAIRPVPVHKKLGVDFEGQSIFTIDQIENIGLFVYISFCRYK